MGAGKGLAYPSFRMATSGHSLVLCCYTLELYCAVVSRHFVPWRDAFVCIQAVVVLVLFADRSPFAASSPPASSCMSAIASCSSCFSPSRTWIAIQYLLVRSSFFKSASSASVVVGYWASLAINAWVIAATHISPRFLLSAKASGFAFLSAFRKFFSCSSSSGEISRSFAS